MKYHGILIETGTIGHSMFYAVLNDQHKHDVVVCGNKVCSNLGVLVVSVSHMFYLSALFGKTTIQRLTIISQTGSNQQLGESYVRCFIFLLNIKCTRILG